MLALVTGGARRIGATIARRLADRYGILIHCNDSTDAARTLAEEIGARGGLAHVVRADLADCATLSARIDGSSRFGENNEIYVEKHDK